VRQLAPPHLQPHPPPTLPQLLTQLWHSGMLKSLLGRNSKGKWNSSRLNSLLSTRLNWES